MALAMSSLGGLATEENFAVSMGWGTFEGENAFAATGAIRLDKKTSFNAGVGFGVGRQTVGARAGFRVGW